MMVSDAPGSVARLGKGDPHTCSTSAKDFVAGYLIIHSKYFYYI